jgi:hypothetical protein
MQEDIRPSDMVTWRLNFPYDPNAPTDPIKKVLSDWVEPGDVSLLTQIPAQALLQMTQSQPLLLEVLRPTPGPNQLPAAALGPYPEQVRKFHSDYPDLPAHYRITLPAIQNSN